MQAQKEFIAEQKKADAEKPADNAAKAAPLALDLAVVQINYDVKITQVEALLKDRIAQLKSQEVRCTNMWFGCQGVMA